MSLLTAAQPSSCPAPASCAPPLLLLLTGSPARAAPTRARLTAARWCYCCWCCLNLCCQDQAVPPGEDRKPRPRQQCSRHTRPLTWLAAVPDAAHASAGGRHATVWAVQKCVMVCWCATFFPAAVQETSSSTTFKSAASRLCRLHTICMLVRLLLCTGQSNISGDHMPYGGFSPCPISMPDIPAPCQRRAAAGRLVCRPPGWPSSCMAAPLGSQQSRCSPRQLQVLGCMLPGRTVLSGLLPTGTCLGPVAEHYWPGLTNSHCCLGWEMGTTLAVLHASMHAE